MRTKESLPELSNEFIIEALNSSSSFEELAKKLNCYKKNIDYRKRNIFHYLNQIGIYEMTFKQLKQNYDEYNFGNKYCLNCGKKLTIAQAKINGKFCCKSCSATYTQMGTKHSEETKSKISTSMKTSEKAKAEREKRRLKYKQIKTERKLNSKEQLKNEKQINRYNEHNKNVCCKICGRELINDECPNEFCRNYRKISFIKLSQYFNFDMSKYGTIYVEQEFQRIKDMLYDLYWNQRMSSILLTNMFNLPTNSIFSYFERFGIPSKSLSYANKESVRENRNIHKISEHFKGRYELHITWNNKEIYLRSINEIKYAEELDSLKILYEYESLRIRYFDTLKNDYRTAIPDFYIPSTNTIIEVKSTFTLDVLNMRDRMQEFKNLGYNFKLIFEFKEMTLDEILNNDLYNYDKNKNILKRIYQHKNVGPRNGRSCKIVNKDGVFKKCFSDEELNNYLNNGWKLGTGRHDKKAGKSRVVRINEQGVMEYKTIDHSELQNYLNNGWFKGKTSKYKILEAMKQKESTLPEN